MNETTTVKKSEFVFRRLAESFDQFVGDIWAAVPLWLLILVGITVVGRLVYRSANPASRVPGAKDTTAQILAWGSWLSVAALVVWVLVAFFNRDSEQAKSAGETVSTIGSGNAIKWYSFTIGLFALGCVFVAFMYFKDTKSVRWYWAVPLALLRITVYAILCFVFLLPAMQTWEDTNKQSRVVILLDISDSVGKTSDETGAGSKKQRTRMEVIIEFLSDEKIAFLKNLLEKNPVAVYAFGSRLDESPTVIAQNDPAWTKAEWEAFAKYDFRPFLLRGLSDEGKEQLKKSEFWQPSREGDADWAATWYARRQDSDDDLKKFSGLSSDQDAEALRKNLERLDKRIDVARTIMRATNVPDSVTAAVNREAANMVQGIIVISDGRSNLGSDSSYVELRERASREKIPVFTITVGEDRQTSAIANVDVQAPDSAPIDEAWEIVVEADGINMANKDVEVELHLFKPGSDINVVDGTGYPQSDHVLKLPLTFQPGDPPHGQVKFVIDPAKFAADTDPRARALVTESKDAAIKKPVLLEGKWGAKAVIARQPEETFRDAYHVRPRPDINVVQQKLRVLLMAGAPSRDFHFLRTALVREVADKRASLSTFVQNEAGTKGHLTPELGETVLLRFPDKLTLTERKGPVGKEDIGYNLNEYDVILAFDPDFSELSQQQADDLRRWVKEGGGGLIYIAGPIHTFQLARIEEGGRHSPILELLPVMPADIVAQRIMASPRTQRRLKLYPERILGSDLLKLDDKVPNDPVAGWERFFTDRERYAPDPDFKKEFFPRRGFYSAYPVQTVKAGSAVLAEFMNVSDANEPVPQPFLVTNNPSAAFRTAFLANGIYQIRSFEPSEKTGVEYFERFWFKLIKYMAAKRNFKAPRGRVLVSKEGVSGTPLRVQARILDETAKPYDRDIGAKFKIVQEMPGGAKREFFGGDLAPKQTAGGAFDGYYAGQVLLDPKLFPADESVYRVVIDVPDSQDTLTGEFRIRQSNPEMDNKRPDFPAMLKMASDFDKDFQARLSDKVKGELGKYLPKEGGGVPRLAFKVTDREELKLIPECMLTQKVQNQNRGPINDLWDKGFTMPTVEPGSESVRKYMTSWWSGQRLSLALLAVVFLLSLEWLVRKLLRLA